MGIAILNVYRNYFNFNGRTSRRDYWLFVLTSWLARIVFLFLTFEVYFRFLNFLGFNTEDLTWFYIPFGLHCILFEIPKISLFVRRLHDSDHSGENIFWLFTAVGLIRLLRLSLMEGTKGSNLYGDEPKEDPNEEMHNILSMLINQRKSINPDAQIKESLNVEKVALSIIKFDNEHDSKNALSDKMEEVLIKLGKKIK